MLLNPALTRYFKASSVRDSLGWFLPENLGHILLQGSARLSSRINKIISPGNASSQLLVPACKVSHGLTWMPTPGHKFNGGEANIACV